MVPVATRHIPCSFGANGWAAPLKGKRQGSGASPSMIFSPKRFGMTVKWAAFHLIFIREGISSQEDGLRASWTSFWDACQATPDSNRVLKHTLHMWTVCLHLLPFFAIAGAEQLRDVEAGL